MISLSYNFRKFILLNQTNPIIARIELFEGPQPESSVNYSGELLAVLEWEEKYRTFVGLGIKNGVAGWFRGFSAPDHDSEQLDYVDGTVGVAGSDLLISNIKITQGEIVFVRLNQF